MKHHIHSIGMPFVIEYNSKDMPANLGTIEQTKNLDFTIPYIIRDLDLNDVTAEYRNKFVDIMVFYAALGLYNDYNIPHFIDCDFETLNDLKNIYKFPYLIEIMGFENVINFWKTVWFDNTIVQQYEIRAKEILTSENVLPDAMSYAYKTHKIKIFAKCLCAYWYALLDEYITVDDFGKYMKPLYEEPEDDDEDRYY